MRYLFLGLLFGLMFSPQPIVLANSLNTGNNDKVQYRSLRVDYKHTINFVYNNKIYTVYATSCGEIINKYNKDLNYIILSPGEPIELKDDNGNILILYSLPCN